MSLNLYMDVHVRWAITDGLRRRGVDVLTAQEDGTAQFDDLLREASRRQEAGERLSGVIYAHQLRITIGQAIRDLELIAQVYDPSDMENRVEYLPL